jgi:DNA-binding XRE family transcriptional regulator
MINHPLCALLDDVSLLMRSRALDVLPRSVRQSVRKLGTDIATARRKRRLTMAMMSERIGVSKQTYQRIEAGDPSVGIGAYAMTLFVLGLGSPLEQIADQARDDQGLLLEAERLPKRVRRGAGSGAA